MILVFVNVRLVGPALPRLKVRIRDPQNYLVEITESESK
jgi:hypothetical protein